MFEVNNDEKKYLSEKVDGRGRLRCPMCRGRGYFEPSQQTESPIISYSAEKETENLPQFKLPLIQDKGLIREPYKQQRKVTLPSIRRTNNFSDKKVTGNVSSSKLNPLIAADERGSTAQESVLVDHVHGKQNPSKPITINSDSNESEIGAPLNLSAKTPRSSHDILKSSLIRLNGSDWNDSLSALKEIVQISKYQPDVIESSMAVVYRGLIALLKSFRSKITRMACQAVNELFSNVPSTQRPEFDELVSTLLQKTADTNKFVRRDANEALDSMVINTLPMHSVRTLVQKGISHRNSIVRTTAVRLLVCIVGLVGVRNLFSGNKDTRNRVVNAAAYCLQDGCQEVRTYACRIMKMLMNHEDFDEVLHGNVNDTIIGRIEKTLITLKYHK